MQVNHKQSSTLFQQINYHKQSSTLFQQSASSYSPVIDKSNRKLLVFCVLLLTLLILGSSLQLALSCLPTTTYDLQGAFIGRRFYGESAVTQAGTEDFVHEVRQAVHADMYRDKALSCDRSHYRTDVCVATSRDVRVLGAGTAHARSYQVLVFAEQGPERIEKVKPYTRKWETSVMETIDEVMIIKKVLLNRRSSPQNPSPLHSYNPDHPLPWISSDLQKNNLVMEQSAKLQQRKRHQSATTRVERLHQKGLHKRRPSGNRKQQQQQHLQEAPRSVNAQLRLQQEKLPPVRPIIASEAATTLQHRKAALEASDDHFPACEVQHEVPAILFSTGGYTGNVYHEFNDGLIPLFITAQQYSPGQVVLIVLEFHGWWMSRYAEVVAQISNHTVIDLAHDNRVHCFPEVTVGLHIHDELAIHAENPRDHASIQGFQSMLRAAYADPRFLDTKKAALRSPGGTSRKKLRPKLVVLSRSSPRALLNEGEVIALAKEIGFSVQVLTPTPWTRMVEIYKIVSRCDVLVGVHGAAMTHLIFMRPGATLIQVVPLGTEWAAATYYGQPAQKLGLNYIAYKVSPRESSLWHKYGPDDAVLVNPESVNQKGWWETKRIYLEAQDVTVLLPRMRVTLLSVYARTL